MNPIISSRAGPRRGSVAAWPGLQADERALHPIHLSGLAEVERAPPRHRVNPHDRLALRALVRRQPSRRVAGHHRVPRATRAGLHVQPFQPLDALSERRWEGVIRRGAIREQRLSLALRDWSNGKKQRNIRRRPAIALVGVPALALWILRRKLTIGGERRVGTWRGLAADRGNI